MKAMVCSDPDQLLPLAEPPCLIGTEGKSRDVVQPCHHRQEYLFKRAALPDFLQPVQRNRPFQGERPRPCTPQPRHMANRAKRMCNVARQAADIGALGATDREGDCVQSARSPGTNGKMKYGNGQRLPRHPLTRPLTVIGKTEEHPTT